MTKTDHDAFHEYYEAEKADVAKRYDGFRCADCIYWFVKDWRVEKAVLTGEDIGYHEPRAECRRRAPLPQTLLALRAGQLIGSIAWSNEQLAHIKHLDPEIGYDYALEGANVDEIANGWPVTQADHWCGEGKAGRKAMSAETISRLEGMHAKAFPPEPEEEGK